MQVVDTMPSDPVITAFEPLLTGEEGFVAFERAVLSATQSVIASFRIFDPSTRLRSLEAKEVGDTWFDLILAKLDEGIRFDITVADFDPVLATEHHQRSWSSARKLAALNELSRGAALNFDIALHPARVGALPQLAFQVPISTELKTKSADSLTPGLETAKDAFPVPMVPATHHQKMAVIDERLLYIGGLDLNERRYDTLDHARPADETWHDINAMVEGPVVQSVLRHLKDFKAICAGDLEPTAQQPGFLRTLSTARTLPVVHISPKSVITELEEAHLSALSRSPGPLYFETQFFRHLPLAEAMSEAAACNPALTCMMVLPAAPDDVAFDGNRRQDAQLGAQKQMEALDVLREGFGKRLALVSPARPVEAPADPVGGALATLHDAPIIYVHSKVSLFGMTEAIISSANLNGRSLKWDTEAGIHFVQTDHISRLWNRVLTHWFGDLAPDPNQDPLQFVDWINAAAAENMVTKPADRQHLLLPYPVWRDAELAAPLPGIPDEMV